MALQGAHPASCWKFPLYFRCIPTCRCSFCLACLDGGSRLCVLVVADWTQGGRLKFKRFDPTTVAFGKAYPYCIGQQAYRPRNGPRGRISRVREGDFEFAHAGVQFSENWCGAVTGVGALSVGDVQFGCRTRVVKSSSEAIVAPR